MLPEGLIQKLKAASLESALESILAHFECQAGTYHTANGQLLTLAASLHIPPPVVALIEKVPVGKGIAGLAAERRAAITICNLQTDESGQARPAAKNTGMEGSLAVPALRADGSVAGVLGIAKAQAHDWSEAETADVTAAAAILAERQLH
jgi:putative methionine-R-sulfoxide reductase with GAF domain